jgi:phosphatidylserine decarboxylase
MIYLKNNNIYNHHEFYILITICSLSYITNKYHLGIFFTIVIIFLLYFHRNIEYDTTNTKDNILYSPAQGKILNIKKGKTTTKISIFLSVFDDHTQCIPIECTKVNEIFNYGNFYFAQNEEGSEYNQQLKHILKTKFGYIEIVQYTGFFTRRIYSLSSYQDKIYKIGDKLGYIRFGSRVDIFIPNRIINDIFVEKNMKINMLYPLVKLQLN